MPVFADLNGLPMCHIGQPLAHLGNQPVLALAYDSQDYKLSAAASFGALRLNEGGGWVGPGSL